MSAISFSKNRVPERFSSIKCVRSKSTIWVGLFLKTGSESKGSWSTTLPMPNMLTQIQIHDLPVLVPLICKVNGRNYLRIRISATGKNCFSLKVFFSGELFKQKVFFASQFFLLICSIPKRGRDSNPFAIWKNPRSNLSILKPCE